MFIEVFSSLKLCLHIRRQQGDLAQVANVSLALFSSHRIPELLDASDKLLFVHRLDDSSQEGLRLVCNINLVSTDYSKTATCMKGKLMKITTSMGQRKNLSPR